MDSQIITGIITAVVTIMVCLINNGYQGKRTEGKIKSQLEILQYQFAELTRHVEKHNNVIERTYKLEEKASLMEEKISVASHRIEDLEKKSN